MSDKVLVSLCIPTNGIAEWVFPVLNSIYAEQADTEKYEVIVTDNGNDAEFEKAMHVYCNEHENLIYKKTEAVQFLNQIEAFKLASGEMIKFINHRQMLMPGAINYLMDFVRKNVDEKPGVYFMNGAIEGRSGIDTYDSFDSYVAGLQLFSSWSAGTTMWKSDFDKMDLGQPFNQLFPHTNLIFSDKEKKKYIIDHSVLFEDIPVDDTKKGRYNLFYAFAVEYVSIILDLYRNGFISNRTFHIVKKDNLRFVAQLYYRYILMKRPCSYDLSGYKDAVRVFYSHRAVCKTIVVLAFEKLIGRKNGKNNIK